MSLLSRIKAWAFRKPVTGPSYSPKPETVWDALEFHVKHPLGKDFVVTKDMRLDAQMNLAEFGRRKAARQLELLLKDMHTNMEFGHHGVRSSGMSVPTMVAVGISAGIF